MKLYNGDCLEVMDKLIDEGVKVDLIITSPPYNLGNKHHTGNKTFKAYNNYDDNLPEKEYQEWQLKFLNKCYNILKGNGSMWYNHKNRIKNGKQITPYEWILKSKFIVKQEVIWENGSQNFDKTRFYPMTERVYWLAKQPKTKMYNEINHKDVFTKQRWKPRGTKGEHKRAYPKQMCVDIMTCFKSSFVILDPFMGSGTTGIACKELDRDFIGIELDEKYFKLAKNRIENHKVQESLF